jgi:3-isopropylmalate/(R)-2-methylmalate dehydratase small subunit
MEPFRNFTGIVVPLDRANVDTDAIMPKQFLKAIGRTGFGPNLFDEWRYLDRGEPGQDCSRRPLNPDFVLNDARYRGARVFLARDNFGCGSSREHAPQSIAKHGFKAIVAESFAEIFFGNSIALGIPCVSLVRADLDQLAKKVESRPETVLTVDLVDGVVRAGNDLHWPLGIKPGAREALQKGLWDPIGQLLEGKDQIRAVAAALPYMRE